MLFSRVSVVMVIMSLVVLRSVYSQQVAPGPIICNNREARIGGCVKNSPCKPKAPDPGAPADPGDPNAKPPRPASPARPPAECGGLSVQITGRILVCQPGPEGGHCRDLIPVVCAMKGFCKEQRDGRELFCGVGKGAVTGVTGWQTQEESIPCLIRKPSGG